NLSDANFLRGSVGAIGIDPTNHNNVYVVTGLSLLTLSHAAVGVGTYVSHDAGKPFVRPTVNTHGYATNVTTASPRPGCGIAGSSGLHWGTNNVGSSSDPIGRVSLAYADNTGQKLWALVSDAGRTAGQQLADLPALPAGSPTGNSLLNGLYYSTDDGAHWKIE